MKQKQNNSGEKREFFAGSNSCYGFWSYFESIASDKDMVRLLIKSGPGSGKSTMIKKVGHYFEEKGCYTEWFHCPSDPDSMDAVSIPQARFCIIDATMPHAVAPKRPKDEIVDLWKYWQPGKQGQGIGKNQLEHEKKDGEYEKWCLNEQEKWKAEEKEWRETLEKEKFYPHLRKEFQQQEREIEEQFFQDTATVHTEKQLLRHLFAAGVTPDGVVCLDNFMTRKDWKCTRLEIGMSPFLEYLMENLVQKCLKRGIPAEVYHSPVDPRRIDAVALPQAQKLLISAESWGIHYMKDEPVQTLMMMPSAQCHEHCYFHRNFDKDFMVKYLHQRRQRHQTAEERYHAAIDYTGIEEETQRIIQRFDCF